MLRIVWQRLVIAVPTMFLVSTFTFFLVHLVPGSPADYILGAQPSQQQVRQLNQQLGLNRPVIDQYFNWLGHAVRGQFGVSYTTHQAVSAALSTALEPTLSLAILSTGVALAAGLALGMVAAVRGGRVDRAIQGASSLGLAIPSFWLGALLVTALSLGVHIFPATGYTTFGSSPWQWFVSIVLPVCAVATGALAQIVLQARTSVLDVLGRDFVRTLQAVGLPRRRILVKHVMRNASIPVTTLAGLTFVYALSGVVVVETVFNLPGMGTLIVDAANHHDIPVLQGAVIYFSLVVVGVTLVVDLLTAWLDPRLHLT